MFQELPLQTQQIADVVGRDRALYLVRNWKRTRTGNPKQLTRVSVYIPLKISANHELARVMGWDDASKLVRAFRGEILHLSTCEEVFRNHRNYAIRRLTREAKMKPRELSEWFEISERQVRNVLNVEGFRERRSASIH